MIGEQIRSTATLTTPFRRPSHERAHRSRITHSTQDFYDHLASEYHPIFGNWGQAVRRQGKVLEGLLRSKMSVRRLSILDCSCGIGTQAIDLALCRHKLTTHISPESVNRAKREAQRLEVHLTFSVAVFSAP